MHSILFISSIGGFVVADNLLFLTQLSLLAFVQILPALCLATHHKPELRAIGLYQYVCTYFRGLQFGFKYGFYLNWFHEL